jgi:flagellar basal-body rod protein FlgG
MILEMTRPVQGGLRQDRKLETVSNNLANVTTTGFKKDVLSFDKAFKAQLNKDYSQGDITPTGNPLDVAIAGEGFFKVDTDIGIQYTRDGNFSLDSQGTLVDLEGNPVLGQGGPIVIDPLAGQGQPIQISETGEISANGEVIDTLDIVTFEDLGKLERNGKNLLNYTGETTDEIVPDNVKVESESLEKSNVQVVDEMVKMVDYNRMFETFTKSMSTFDDIDDRAVNDIAQPT